MLSLKRRISLISRPLKAIWKINSLNLIMKEKKNMSVSKRYGEEIRTNA